MTYGTILYDVDPESHVATITLNRPERLNAFNRAMCEEISQAWRAVKDDDSVHAVVIRAAGDRAFSAGLDVQESFGQPEMVWNHVDPGALLAPKGQHVWKPVVCAVHGICTAGAFYFVNEADVVICSPDATFFDSHVTYGMVSAIEPVGLMRRIGLGDTLRMALLGNRERVGADTALRIGLVTEVVPRADLWARADELATTIASYPPVATQGTVRAVWESLDKPYRAAVEQGLMYTRLGNPIGMAQVDRAGVDKPPAGDPVSHEVPPSTRVERWTFGEAPLAETRRAGRGAPRPDGHRARARAAVRGAARARSPSCAGAQRRLAALLPGRPRPRLGDDARARAARLPRPLARRRRLQRVLPDATSSTWHDDRAEGRVEFPLVYEGPPGVVHGGFLAVFFDCVLQQLNCDMGQAGKTRSLALRYRRPVPILTELAGRRAAHDRRRRDPVHRRAPPRRHRDVRGRDDRGARRPRRAPGRVAETAGMTRRLTTAA